jgi:hypothetical protein
MPGVNPRRERPCRDAPLLTERFEEEAIGRGHFIGMAVFAVLLGLGQASAWGGGWVARIVVAALDLLWILLLLAFLHELRIQARQGLGHVRPDAPSFTLGEALVLFVGAAGGLGGLRSIEVWLRCVDAFMEERKTSEQGGTEPTRVCYVVWEDRREEGAVRLRGVREARFEFALPASGDLVGPWGSWLERYWEVEVVRHGGGASLRFRVLVYP